MSDPSLQWIAVTDVASLLGVATSTIRRWGEAGVIPKPHKIGGRSLWSLQELRAWQDSLLQHTAGGPGVFA